MLLAIGIAYGIRWHRSAQIVFLQHQCGTYTLPLDRIVFTDQMKNATELLRSSEFEIYNWNGWSGVGRRLPQCFANLLEAKTIHAGLTKGPAVMLHEREDARDNEHVIVLVQLIGREPTGDLLFSVHIVGNTSFASRLVTVPMSPHELDGGMKIYPAKIDSHNMSKFCFYILANKKKIRIDGEIIDERSISLVRADRE